MFIPVIQEIVDSCFLPPVLQELLRGRLPFVCFQISELSSATNVRDHSLPWQLRCQASQDALSHLSCVGRLKASTGWLNSDGDGWCGREERLMLPVKILQLKNFREFMREIHCMLSPRSVPGGTWVCLQIDISGQSSTGTLCSSPGEACCDWEPALMHLLCAPVSYSTVN